LKVTDTHGDTDTVTKQDYILVTTGSVPEADFTGAPTVGCDPITVSFTNTTTGGDAPLSYEWDIYFPQNPGIWPSGDVRH
jgi:PKD repeat protein